MRRVCLDVPLPRRRAAIVLSSPNADENLLFHTASLGQFTTQKLCVHSKCKKNYACIVKARETPPFLSLPSSDKFAVRKLDDMVASLCKFFIVGYHNKRLLHAVAQFFKEIDQ